MRFLTFTLLFTALSISAFASQNKEQVRIRIQSTNGNLDETTVYFDQGINSTYAYQEDAQKIVSGVAGVPVIYTVTTDNIHCSINGYGTYSTSQLVPIGIVIDESGTYNLTCPMLDNFDPTSIITLEDRTLGVKVDLRTNFYPVQLDTADAPEGRFFIRVSSPSTFSTTVAGCTNNDAELHVTTDPSVIWDSYELFNANNDSVGMFYNVNTAVDFTSLAQGDYHMVRKYGAYSTTSNFHINGTYIAASIGASATQVVTYENVAFSANAINANHFEWDFGDGTLISGVAHPDLSYYQPGIYMVTLHCSNDHGCSANAQIQIIVSQSVTGIKEETAKEVSVVAQGKNITIDMNNPVNASAQMQVYNLLGQSVYNTPIVAEKTTVSLDEQPVGYYIVGVKNGDKTSTKRIFISK